jgi:hypothetical protein
MLLKNAAWMENVGGCLLQHPANLSRTMMVAADFRRIALGMRGAVEGAHMGHPDFRVAGRIFATLHADFAWGMVKLTPDQQERFVQALPAVFVPEPGAWGRQGCTAVRLDAVEEDVLGEALTLAWRNIAERRPPSRTAGRASPSRKR